MIQTDSDLMTVRDVSRFLNVCKNTVYTLMDVGALEGVKILGTYRIYRKSLLTFMERAVVAPNVLAAAGLRNPSEVRMPTGKKKKPRRKGRGSQAGFQHIPLSGGNPPGPISDR